MMPLMVLLALVWFSVGYVGSILVQFWFRSVQFLLYYGLVWCSLGSVALFSGCAYSYTQEQAINAVIGEAEGEPQIGKEAVACAIHNRGYLTGVYGLHAPRVVKHMYSPHTYKMARQAVIVAKDQGYCEGLVNGAQYWASLKVDQSWIHKMLAMGYVHTATYGGQAFFRKN